MKEHGHYFKMDERGGGKGKEVGKGKEAGKGNEEGRPGSKRGGKKRRKGEIGERKGTALVCCR